MAKVVEERPVTIWDEFTMQRDSDSPVQLRLPYTPEEWAALTPEVKEANRQAAFDKWQSNTDALREAARLAEEAAVGQPVPVPERIAMHSARKIMFASGVLDRVIDVVRAAGEEAETLFWSSDYLERQHPMLLQLAPLIPLTEEQIDDMFRQGEAA